MGEYVPLRIKQAILFSSSLESRNSLGIQKATKSRYSHMGLIVNKMEKHGF